MEEPNEKKNHTAVHIIAPSIIDPYSAAITITIISLLVIVLFFFSTHWAEKKRVNIQVYFPPSFFNLVDRFMEKNGEDDRISALPDCLLLEILSLLHSTKEAIRTGALSKRWQHVWTRVPTLSFSPADHRRTFLNPKSMSDFALLVDKTLTQCRQLKLKKFQVFTVYDIRFESQFRDWLRFAISCNVEELKLEFWREKGEFVLDQFPFINSCFTDLRLAQCKLNPSGTISWENLRSLRFFRMHLDEELLANIVSGSPLLESLVLEYCKWPHIPSESESESESDITEISARTSLSLTQCRPLKKLKKFKLSTSYDIQFHSQINNSIRYAISCNVEELNLQLTHRYEVEFMLDQVLFTSSCFAELRLEGCMLNPGGAISWKSLRFLRLSNYMSLDEDLIEKILSGSPVLETLELKSCYGYRRLDINSKSVQNLVLDGYKVPYDEAEDDVIEINAPHILSLTIQNVCVLRKPLLLNVSCVVNAHLDYTCRELGHWSETPKEAEQEMLKGIMMNLHHIKELKLGFLCAQVLSLLQGQGFVPPSNVKLA